MGTRKYNTLRSAKTSRAKGEEAATTWKSWGTARAYSGKLFSHYYDIFQLVTNLMKECNNLGFLMIPMSGETARFSINSYERLRSGLYYYYYHSG